MDLAKSISFVTIICITNRIELIGCSDHMLSLQGVQVDKSCFITDDCTVFYL